MTDDLAGSEKQARVRSRGQGETFVWTAVGLGVALAVVALIIGLTMAFDRRVAPCRNGTFFPEGATDFNCYVHPEGVTGTAIALFALLLGTLIVFSGISAALALQSRSEGEGSGQ